jgi:hypothetical protein
MVPANDVTYTAQYAQQNLLVLSSTPSTGGTAFAFPAAPNFNNYYNSTDSIAIHASPAIGYSFTGFSGDLKSSTSPAVLAMSVPRAVTANFAIAQAPSLNVVLANDVSRAAQPSPIVTAFLVFQNTGGAASAVSIINLIPRVLSPSNVLASITTSLPISVGTIPANGSSRPVPIQMNIPPEAVRTLISGSAIYDGGSFAFSFTVVRPPISVLVPSISSVTPSSALRGKTITLSGVNFDSTCNNDTILIAGTTVHPTAPCSANELRFSVPFDAAAGPTTIRVATTAGSSTGESFTVLKTRVVVAATPTPLGSYGGSTDQFVVIDFSEAATPSVRTLSPQFASGASVVDCSGSKLAVGDALGGLVALYDITNPSVPVKLGSLNTGFGSIGAIKFDGTRVLVGDYFGSSVTLIDLSAPVSPRILSTIHQIFGIVSLGMFGTKAVAAGNNAEIAIFDYTSPTQPSWTTFLPRAGSALTVDLDRNLAAAAALDDSLVTLVDINGPAVVSHADPGICRPFPPDCVAPPDKCGTTCINSVSIKGTTVAVSSDTHRYIALIDFASFQSPVVTTLDPQLGVAAPIVVFDGQYLAAGAINAANAISYVNLFRIAGSSATLLGSIKSGLPSVGAIGMCTF